MKYDPRLGTKPRPCHLEVGRCRKERAECGVRETGRLLTRHWLSAISLRCVNAVRSPSVIQLWRWLIARSPQIAKVIAAEALLMSLT